MFFFFFFFFFLFYLSSYVPMFPVLFSLHFGSSFAAWFPPISPSVYIIIIYIVRSVTGRVTIITCGAVHHLLTQILQLWKLLKIVYWIYCSALNILVFPIQLTYLCNKKQGNNIMSCHE